MSVIDLGLALILGLIAAWIGSLVAGAPGKLKETAERIARLGRMRAEALDADPGEETFLVSKSMIEQALQEHTKPAKFAWASNFLWFGAGALVSVFTSEIRGMAGLG